MFTGFRTYLSQENLPQCVVKRKKMPEPFENILCKIYFVSGQAPTTTTSFCSRETLPMVIIIRRVIGYQIIVLYISEFDSDSSLLLTRVNPTGNHTSVSALITPLFWYKLGVRLHVWQ